MSETTHYTQVELTSPRGEVEVIWLPVPVGRAHVGEKITRTETRLSDHMRGDQHYEEDWTISQVCITLLAEDLPPKARVAKTFHREAQTIAYMSI